MHAMDREIGCAGDFRYGQCDVNGASITGNLLPSDIGKWIRILRANGSTFETIVRGVNQLSDPWPDAPLVDAPFHMGFDDGPKLTNLLRTMGSHDLGDGQYFVRQGPVFHTGNINVGASGARIVVDRGWPSGFGLVNESYINNPRTTRYNVYFLGDCIVENSFISEDSAQYPRKGIGLCNIEEFICEWTHHAERGWNLFGIQVQDSAYGQVIRPSVYTRNTKEHKGADGNHFLRNSHHVDVIDGVFDNEDDCTSVTIEQAVDADCQIHNINFIRGQYITRGFSNVKGLITSITGTNAQIRRILYQDPTFITYLTPLGAGVPVIYEDNNTNPNSYIEDLEIHGGTTTVRPYNYDWSSVANNFGMVAFRLRNIKRVLVRDHTIRDAGYCAIDAVGCGDIRWWRGSILPAEGRVFTGTTNKGVVDLTSCPVNSIDESGIVPKLPGQLKKRVS